jgi:glyoxylase-like metal-dependent hydrolase (beta-lactamase superfamily II)
VQQAFGEVFNAGEDFRRDGSQFDRLWADGETFAVGALAFRVLAVPGHTPACVAYQVGDAVFAGDTLFMPDVGTARTDFPGGDAATLFRSIRRLLELPPETRIFVCHDYPPAGRTATFETTVAAERAGNIHVRDGVTEQEFVTLRTQRDATLAMPVLLLPAVQVNMRAGELPPAEANGVAYLKIPIDAL